MTRSDVINEFDEDAKIEDLKVLINDFIDEIESGFADISSKLDGVTISTLDDIYESKNIAQKFVDDLY